MKNTYITLSLENSAGLIAMTIRVAAPRHATLSQANLASNSPQGGDPK